MTTPPALKDELRLRNNLLKLMNINLYSTAYKTQMQSVLIVILRFFLSYFIIS